jgi:hypothetical protein
MSCPCGRKHFSNKRDWVSHLQAQHVLHPKWDDKNCQFCSQVVAEGGATMMRHVEHHLQEISLAALPLEADEDEDAESDSEHTGKPSEASDGETGPPNWRPRNPSPIVVDLRSIQNHPVYRSAVPQEDGLWHCPWEGEDCCNHEPTMLKEDHE